jgi:hypothetical protein
LAVYAFGRRIVVSGNAAGEKKVKIEWKLETCAERFIYLNQAINRG